jgi:hypothetical protein
LARLTDIAAKKVKKKTEKKLFFSVFLHMFTYKRFLGPGPDISLGSKVFENKCELLLSLQN